MEKKAITMMIMMTQVHLKVKVKVMTTPVNRKIPRKKELIDLWKYLNPPVEEKDLIDHWFGAVYTQGKKKYFYIGKLKKRFLDDGEGNVYAVELDCLKLWVVNGTILESYPINFKGDVFVFDIHDIIKTAKVTLLRGTKWDVPDYVSLEKRFQKFAVQSIYEEKQLIT